MDDRELLARLRRGDSAAFDALFRAWYPRLVRTAAAIVRETAVAEELVQDALLALWQRREQLDPDGAAHAWLLQTVRNRALNHVRHLKVVERTAPYAADDPVSEPTVHATLDAATLQDAVRDAIATLPPRCREVFELSRSQGLKYAEIAAALDISVKAVEAQMGRALRLLRERLARWLPGGQDL